MRLRRLMEYLRFLKPDPRRDVHVNVEVKTKQGRRTLEATGRLAGVCIKRPV